MTETRYFIFNHEEAFAECRLEGFVWREDALRPIAGAGISVISTPVLDSGETGNVWQRISADITLFDNSRITWRLFASERKEADGACEVFTTSDTDDFLPVGVKGRYLRLEAQLYGNAEIRSVQIYQSWESFIDYLPEIYRDYNGFTDRFLRLFAAQYLDVERKIDTLPGTFDPSVSPPDTLRWLAELVGVPHIGEWETDGLRKLLTSGIYKRRGQFSVFADYIEYFTGHRPYIAEHFRYMTGRREYDRLYDDGDVTVFLPPKAAGTDLETLDTVIADFLPEDISCRVIVLDSCPVVSGYAYLGINTRIGRYEEAVVGISRIGVSVIGGMA